MDGTVSGSRFSSSTYTPIKLKQCVSEQKRQGLERLLSAVYKREVSIEQLLKECGASDAVVEGLRQRNTSSIADQMIREVKQLVSRVDGTDRMYQIIERFYGLDGNMPARLSAMSKKHGVSRERIRQIKERALSSIRFRKSSIERLLLMLTMRLLARKNEAAKNESTACQVTEIDGFKLLNHRELLMMHESQLPATEEQAKVLFDVNWAKRARFAGCAGSGKTWLALMIARKMAAEGKRTLLTCFNRALADHLADLLQNEQNLIVTSFHALCLRFGKQAGIPIPGGWNSHTWLERFPALLKKAVLADPALKFEAVIVDDGHEMRDGWWSALEATLIDSPSSRLYYFVDDNQWKGCLPTQYPEVDLVSHLTINLRTPAVISSILRASYAGKHPMRFARASAAPVEFYRCETDNEVHQTLSHVFIDLVDKGTYLGSEIAIITPRLPRYSAAAKAHLRSAAKIVRRPSDVRNHTILTRCHTFQGLERKVVIIVDLDERFSELPADEIRSFVYMTFTRFVDKLIILGSSAVWSRIDALTEIEHSSKTVAARVQWLEQTMERI